MVVIEFPDPDVRRGEALPAKESNELTGAHRSRGRRSVGQGTILGQGINLEGASE